MFPLEARVLSKGRRILLILFPILIGCLSAALVLSIVYRQKVPTSPANDTPRKLPDDVDMVMERYKLQETDEGLKVDISGNRVVHRGRKILGLRSNLVKTTYFENIRGTVSSEKALVRFSASDAEWDATSSSPLVLRGNIVLCINDRRFNDVKNARIYLRQGILEVAGKRNEVFQLRKY